MPLLYEKHGAVAVDRVERAGNDRMQALPANPHQCPEQSR